MGKIALQSRQIKSLMKPQLLSSGLRYFMAVAESQSLSAAASRLHVAVSAVSRQIANLEDQFECALFDRHTKGVTMTEAGERLMTFARLIQQDADRIIEDVRGISLNGSGIVRVGCVEGLSVGFMPGVMASFRRLFPGICVHLQVAPPDEISRLLRKGEVDVALKYCVAPEPALETAYQHLSPIMALVAPHHPIARRRRIKALELVQQSLAVPESGNTVRTAFDLCCTEQGLSYVPAFTGNAASTMSLAMQGDAVLLSGELGAAHLITAGQLVAIKIDEEAMKARALHVLLLQGRTLPRTANAFVTHVVGAIRSVKPRTGTRRHLPPVRAGAARTA